jgi:hypothetical protein
MARKVKKNRLPTAKRHGRFANPNRPLWPWALCNERCPDGVLGAWGSLSGALASSRQNRLLNGFIFLPSIFLPSVFVAEEPKTDAKPAERWRAEK